MNKICIIVLLIILGLFIPANIKADNIPASWSQKDGINFAGVNLVSAGGSPEWMFFKPGCYQKSNLEGYLHKVGEEFNLIRVCVGAEHVIHSEISATYLNNLLHTLNTAKSNNLWFQIAFWPTNVTSSCGAYENDQWDPYFVAQNREKYKQALKTVAKLVVDNGLLSNLLYIDIRNELSGHIGGTYDSEGSVPWGEIPVDADPYYREWLKDKYTTIQALNSSWGADFSSFNEVPLYRSGNANSTVESTYSNPNTVRKDQQDWIIWAFRDWTTIMRDAIRSVDPRIRVGQSTTESQMHYNRALSDFTNTNEIFRQSDIGGIVDVFDFHSYKRYGGGGDYIGEFQRLKNGWPNTIYVMGETWNENDQVLKIIEGGGDGILFWDEPGNPQIWNRGSWSDVDSWTLSSYGQKFVSQIKSQKNYIYPSASLPPTPTASPLPTNPPPLLHPQPSLVMPTVTARLPVPITSSGSTNTASQPPKVTPTPILISMVKLRDKTSCCGSTIIIPDCK